MKPEFVLPGVSLLTTARTSSYTAMTGTSVSAALFSGVLALILEASPGYKRGSEATVRQVKVALMETSVPLEGQETPHDNWYGYGLTQAYYAHLRLSSMTPAS